MQVTLCIYGVLGERKNRKEESAKMEERNKKACEMVVTNGCYVLKEPTGSARDFIKLNDKDDLNTDLDCAEKNDGAEIYFELRKMAFEKLTENIKTMIRDCETLGATLDKVTIGGTSYTVIVTHFFWQGSLRTVLNELYVMTSRDGDGMGVAEMLCLSLMKTLGLTKEELRDKLEHLSYDGVYEQTLHRVRGGGSLSLIDHVADFLDFGLGIITGAWDLGHKIQLVLSDVCLKGDSEKIYSKHMDEMYSLMKEYKGDKKGLIFLEVSEELLNPTLKQRSRQETRWAKVDLSAMHAFFRNSPTIYTILGRDAEASRLKNNVTAQKQLLKKRENLRNPMFWLHMVAFAQIFNIIVEASLEAQHETYLSTSALHMVTKAMEKIKALGENWVWEEEALTFSGIGSTRKHLENLKNVFSQPVVGLKAKDKNDKLY